MQPSRVAKLKRNREKEDEEEPDAAADESNAAASHQRKGQSSKRRRRDEAGSEEEEAEPNDCETDDSDGESSESESEEPSSEAGSDDEWIGSDEEDMSELSETDRERRAWESRKAAIMASLKPKRIEPSELMQRLDGAKHAVEAELLVLSDAFKSEGWPWKLTDEEAALFNLQST